MPERPGSPRVRRVLAVTCAGIGLAALGLYLVLGRSDLPDQPYQARLAQWNTLKDQAPNRLAPQELAALLKGQAAKTEQVESDLQAVRRMASAGEPLIQTPNDSITTAK